MTAATVPASEFTILDNGLRFTGGKLPYAWFRLADAQGYESYRAVAFRELAYLPIEVRDDPDVLGKQWAAVRGLYNAGVDFLYTALGAFLPDHVGVVQFYGAAAEAGSEDAAATVALRGMAAVEATLANYPQSRLVSADGRRVQMLLDRMLRLSHLIAILGHPDPRLAKKGLGRDGAMGMADDELSEPARRELVARAGQAARGLRLPGHHRTSGTPTPGRRPGHHGAHRQPIRLTPARRDQHRL